MASNAFSEEAINKAIRQKAYNPCIPNVDILNESSKPKVQTFLSAYPENYKFKMVSIFYDLKQFLCFPSRPMFIPCYIKLDNKIIHYHIIQSKEPFDTKKIKAFKIRGSLSFKNTLETDGVGARIINQNCDTSRKEP
ncbi:hypothetical protein BD408DRAFT_420258, partial [Parasitella parasitica]